MVFDWVTAILSVTSILFMVSVIATLYFLEQREILLATIWGFLFLVCMFVFGGMAGCL